MRRKADLAVYLGWWGICISNRVGAAHSLCSDPWVLEAFLEEYCGKRRNIYPEILYSMEIFCVPLILEVAEGENV